LSLEFSHIAHAYGAPGQSEHALEDVSFTALGGEITCLLGASGCGKSTLLNLAAGLLPLQQGRIALDGEPLAEPGASPPPEARPVGLVFQDGALFPHMTLAKNIAFGLPKDRHGEIESWLARVGLAGLGERYPHQLSGGQQQRVAIARTLAPRPRLVLADEPTGNLDEDTAASVMDLMLDLVADAGIALLMVTHSDRMAARLGTRLTLRQGRIA